MNLPDLNLQNAQLLTLIEEPEPIRLTHFAIFVPFCSNSVSRI